MYSSMTGLNHGPVCKWVSSVATAQGANAELGRDAFDFIEHSPIQALFLGAFSLWLDQASKEKVESTLWYTCFGSRSYS